ncbi:hypothetical protein [Rhodosalinus sp. 5P4]|uniref:hypothetical protein n=1 Tax=Rhodosalinus sp. 5P4 TaxID=3239196 RepID=UPI003524C42E
MPDFSAQSALVIARHGADIEAAEFSHPVTERSGKRVTSRLATCKASSHACRAGESSNGLAGR